MTVSGPLEFGKPDATFLGRMVPITTTPEGARTLFSVSTEDLLKVSLASYANPNEDREEGTPPVTLHIDIAVCRTPAPSPVAAPNPAPPPRPLSPASDPTSETLPTLPQREIVNPPPKKGRKMSTADFVATVGKVALQAGATSPERVMTRSLAVSKRKARQAVDVQELGRRVTVNPLRRSSIVAAAREAQMENLFPQLEEFSSFNEKSSSRFSLKGIRSAWRRFRSKKIKVLTQKPVMVSVRSGGFTPQEAPSALELLDRWEARAATSEEWKGNPLRVKKGKPAPVGAESQEKEKRLLMLHSEALFEEIQALDVGGWEGLSAKRSTFLEKAKERSYDESLIPFLKEGLQQLKECLDRRAIFKRELLACQEEVMPGILEEFLALPPEVFEEGRAQIWVQQAGERLQFFHAIQNLERSLDELLTQNRERSLGRTPTSIVEAGRALLEEAKAEVPLEKKGFYEKERFFASLVKLKALLAPTVENSAVSGSILATWMRELYTEILPLLYAHGPCHPILDHALKLAEVFHEVRNLFVFCGSTLQGELQELLKPHLGLLRRGGRSVVGESIERGVVAEELYAQISQNLPLIRKDSANHLANHRADAFEVRQEELKRVSEPLFFSVIDTLTLSKALFVYQLVYPDAEGRGLEDEELLRSLKERGERSLKAAEEIEGEICRWSGIIRAHPFHIERIKANIASLSTLIGEVNVHLGEGEPDMPEISYDPEIPLRRALALFEGDPVEEEQKFQAQQKLFVEEIERLLAPSIPGCELSREKRRELAHELTQIKETFEERFLVERKSGPLAEEQKVWRAHAFLLQQPGGFTQALASLPEGAPPSLKHVFETTTLQKEEEKETFELLAAAPEELVALEELSIPVEALQCEASFEEVVLECQKLAKERGEESLDSLSKVIETVRKLIKAHSKEGVEAELFDLFEGVFNQLKSRQTEGLKAIIETAKALHEVGSSIEKAAKVVALLEGAFEGRSIEPIVCEALGRALEKKEFLEERREKAFPEALIASLSQDQAKEVRRRWNALFKAQIEACFIEELVADLEEPHAHDLKKQLSLFSEGIVEISSVLASIVIKRRTSGTLRHTLHGMQRVVEMLRAARLHVLDEALSLSLPLNSLYGVLSLFRSTLSFLEESVREGGIRDLGQLYPLEVRHEVASYLILLAEGKKTLKRWLKQGVQEALNPQREGFYQIVLPKLSHVLKSLTEIGALLKEMERSSESAEMELDFLLSLKEAFAELSSYLFEGEPPLPFQKKDSIEDELFIQSRFEGEFFVRGLFKSATSLLNKIHAFEAKRPRYRACYEALASVEEAIEKRRAWGARYRENYPWTAESVMELILPQGSEAPLPEEANKRVRKAIQQLFTLSYSVQDFTLIAQRLKESLQAALHDPGQQRVFVQEFCEAFQLIARMCESHVQLPLMERRLIQTLEGVKQLIEYNSKKSHDTLLRLVAILRSGIEKVVGEGSDAFIPIYRGLSEIRSNPTTLSQDLASFTTVVRESVELILERVAVPGFEEIREALSEKEARLEEGPLPSSEVAALLEGVSQDVLVALEKLLHLITQELEADPFHRYPLLLQESLQAAFENPFSLSGEWAPSDFLDTLQRLLEKRLITTHDVYGEASYTLKERPLQEVESILFRLVGTIDPAGARELTEARKKKLLRALAERIMLPKTSFEKEALAEIQNMNDAVLIKTNLRGAHERDEARLSYAKLKSSSLFQELLKEGEEVRAFESAEAKKGFIQTVKEILPSEFEPILTQALGLSSEEEWNLQKVEPYTALSTGVNVFLRTYQRKGLEVALGSLVAASSSFKTLRTKLWRSIGKSLQAQEQKVWKEKKKDEEALQESLSSFRALVSTFYEPEATLTALRSLETPQALERLGEATTQEIREALAELEERVKLRFSDTLAVKEKWQLSLDRANLALDEASFDFERYELFKSYVKENLPRLLDRGCVRDEEGNLIMFVQDFEKRPLEESRLTRYFGTLDQLSRWIKKSEASLPVFFEDLSLRVKMIASRIEDRFLIGKDAAGEWYQFGKMFYGPLTLLDQTLAQVATRLARKAQQKGASYPKGVVAVLEQNRHMIRAQLFPEKLPLLLSSERWEKLVASLGFSSEEELFKHHEEKIRLWYLALNRGVFNAFTALEESDRHEEIRQEIGIGLGRITEAYPKTRQVSGHILAIQDKIFTTLKELNNTLDFPLVLLKAVTTLLLPVSEAVKEEEKRLAAASPLTRSYALKSVVKKVVEAERFLASMAPRFKAAELAAEGRQALLDFIPHVERTLDLKQKLFPSWKGSDTEGIFSGGTIVNLERLREEEKERISTQINRVGALLNDGELAYLFEKPTLRPGSCSGEKAEKFVNLLHVFINEMKLLGWQQKKLQREYRTIYQEWNSYVHGMFAMPRQGSIDITSETDLRAHFSTFQKINTGETVVLALQVRRLQCAVAESVVLQSFVDTRNRLEEGLERMIKELADMKGRDEKIRRKFPLEEGTPTEMILSVRKAFQGLARLAPVLSGQLFDPSDWVRWRGRINQMDGRVGKIANQEAFTREMRSLMAAVQAAKRGVRLGGGDRDEERVGLMREEIERHTREALLLAKA